MFFCVKYIKKPVVKNSICMPLIPDSLTTIVQHLKLVYGNAKRNETIIMSFGAEIRFPHVTVAIVPYNYVMKHNTGKHDNYLRTAVITERFCNIFPRTIIMMMY